MTQRPMVRLILPHQLFEQHFEVSKDTICVLVEHDLLFRQYAFHSQKLVLHRASIDRFARRLRGHGYHVEVLRSVADRASHDQVAELIRRIAPAEVTCYDVVDDWLEQDLVAALAEGGYCFHRCEFMESPNFLTTGAQIDEWFAHHDVRMHDFYIWQRRRLGILLDQEGQPLGGKWSFDAENRKKLPRRYVPPTVDRFAKHPLHPQEETLDLWTGAEASTPVQDDDAEDVIRAIEWVSAEFPHAPGDPHLFSWPTTSKEAREHLREFVHSRLPDFGPYEDAISTEFAFINHGLLSASMNVGLLDPHEVVQAVLDGSDEHTPLASVEGFVRQVIGWREYMRATYRTRGRRMRSANQLEHRNALGDGWWDATTGLEPVDMVISRVIATGYAHHIERLMVLGNAMCLLRVDPDAAYEWFMELFIDAYDWVMVPNVYGMSQFAAGEEITTKPYVSGSNYLRKMSNLPGGEWTGDWDGLYWTFVADHRDVFSANYRSQMMVSMLDKMDAQKRISHRQRAHRLLHGASGNRLVRRSEQ
ncbi:cryptochrome/photolyase family protein [Nesterenkonia natronophila]|uniref:Cryptochrome/photolyase family protein n=1 Tax=Nesterenkonia natronophila TaxID=2174932 RepID=A0A3A4F346_9MICC|nr:cryptochrome/photolyase family protein [Nesterenkonia natronophila]RJN32161.1 cryptochrome/photolyase family protein [Nesterenkonia natronophila]